MKRTNTGRPITYSIGLYLIRRIVRWLIRRAHIGDHLALAAALARLAKEAREASPPLPLYCSTERRRFTQ
jgi:hypothetical protein